MTIAIENMFPLHVGSRPLMLHANEDLDDLEGIPHLVLDTSHAGVAKHDLVEVRRRFGDRLRHVHLSDNAGRGWDSHLPPGQGVLPLDPFVDDLVASGFDGTDLAGGRPAPVAHRADAPATGDDRDARATRAAVWRRSGSLSSGRATRNRHRAGGAVRPAAIAAAAQLRQPTPSTPYPGPAGGSELPSRPPAG